MINEYIKEFLQFNGYQSTLECLEAEERMSALNQSKFQKKKVSHISSFTTDSLGN
jgi:hypothetical protein